MRMRRWLLASLLLLPAAMTVAAQEAPKIESLSSPVTVRLRGLSAVDANIAWASGREGTVLRTVDAGKTWSVFKVPGAEKLDFRDVEGFSADEAVILSIGPGEDSRIYRTEDGGRSWRLALQNHDPNAFFDCFDFQGSEGWMLGDPVDGRFQIYRSFDAGRSWELQEDGPRAERKEAAFAASGTCITRKNRTTVFITGGSVARAHYLPDGMRKKAFWRVIDSEVIPAAPSAGLFSVDLQQDRLVVVGGNYSAEASPGYGLRAWPQLHLVCISGCDRRDRNDGSAIGPLSLAASGPSGYRSAVACQGENGLCIATGPNGTDALPPDMPGDEDYFRPWLSNRVVEVQVWHAEDGSQTEIRPISVLDVKMPAQWRRLFDAGYDSVDVAGRVFWFSGDGGRLGRLEMPNDWK